MTPGPVAINSATFVGYKVGGVAGSVVATLGVITTSFILVTIINKILDKFKELGLIPILMDRIDVDKKLLIKNYFKIFKE